MGLSSNANQLYGVWPICYVLLLAIRYLKKILGLNVIINKYYQVFKSNKTFNFDGKDYKYFYHPYNTTWENERAIEIPIIMDFINKFKGKKILEIGNVLSHYYPLGWAVLDKYEKGKKIINEDIVDYKPKEKYDLIVSISTLEHVGYDEEIQDPNRSIEAVKNIKGNCLKKGGKFVVTLPLGYNPGMDKLLRKGKIPFSKQYVLKRVLKDNQWKMVDKESILRYKSSFNKLFYRADLLVIGIID